MKRFMIVVAVLGVLGLAAPALAEEKDRGESTVRDELLSGDDIGEVFGRHGIL